MNKLLNVWFVDDLQINLDSFEEAHKKNWNIKKYLNPKQLLDDLKNEKPDALFVDLFFYDTPEQAEEIEKKIKEKTVELREFAKEIEATTEKYLAGINLIYEIKKRYKNKFPVYAYTSKGPYLLDGPALDKLAEIEAPIIYKGRYSNSVEELILEKDLRKYKEQNSLKRKITRHLGKVLIGWGILSWLIGKMLELLYHNTFP